MGGSNTGKHGDWKALGEGDTPVEDMDHGLGHIVSIQTYNRVFATLVALTIITVAAATVDLGWANLPLALAIATFKAGIVTLFFMHLNFENKIIWGIVIYPLFILFLMILGTLGDESVKNAVKPMVAYTEDDGSKDDPMVKAANAHLYKKSKGKGDAKGGNH